MVNNLKMTCLKKDELVENGVDYANDVEEDKNNENHVEFSDLIEYFATHRVWLLPVHFLIINN